MIKEMAESVKDLAKDSIDALSIIVKNKAMVCPECKGRNWVNEPYGECPGGIFKRCSACDGIGKITQEEMIRQAEESIRKKEHGKYQLVYKKDKRTIVAEPRGWEWKPKWNDRVVTDRGTEAQVTMIITDVRISLGDRLNTHFYGEWKDDKWLYVGSPFGEEIIPILPWEEIVQILKEIGYIITAEWDKGLGYFSRIYTKRESCGDPDEKSFILETVGENYQESIMRGVIELRKKR